MIVVTAHPDRKLVRAVMSGLLTTAEVAQFSRDEQAAVKSMGCGSGEFDLLVETIGHQVQTQEVMTAFGRLMIDSPCKARRIATVRSSTLTRMQSQRIARVRSQAEVFETLAEAEAWLRA